jgi:hypothetical protein
MCANSSDRVLQMRTTHRRAPLHPPTPNAAPPTVPLRSTLNEVRLRSRTLNAQRSSVRLRSSTLNAQRSPVRNDHEPRPTSPATSVAFAPSEVRPYSPLASSVFNLCAHRVHCGSKVLPLPSALLTSVPFAPFVVQPYSPLVSSVFNLCAHCVHCGSKSCLYPSSWRAQRLCVIPLSPKFTPREKHVHGNLQTFFTIFSVTYR